MWFPKKFFFMVLFDLGGLKVNANIDLGVNLINIEGVINDFTRKSKVEILSSLQGKPLR